MNRKAPYIFIAALLGLLIFVAGIRYGGSVERQNKAVAFYLSMAPTKTPEVTPSPIDASEVELLKAAQNSCGVTFLYPSSMDQTQSASGEAQLDSAKHTIRFSCNIDNPLFDSARDTTLPQEAINVAGRKINARVQTVGKGKAYSFSMAHPLTGKPVAFLIDEGMIVLFGRTLEFTR